MGIDYAGPVLVKYGPVQAPFHKGIQSSIRMLGYEGRAPRACIRPNHLPLSPLSEGLLGVEEFHLLYSDTDELSGQNESPHLLDDELLDVKGFVLHRIKWKSYPSVRHILGDYGRLRLRASSPI